jgi:hypothetical protein
MITKDYEISQFSVSKLTEQNKDLQKSLTQCNEKVYAADRRVAAMEFESNAIKEKVRALYVENVGGWVDCKGGACRLIMMLRIV